MRGFIKREVVVSIKPKWVKKIFAGEKLAELRKTSPQVLQIPFKAYIYETKEGVGAVVGEFDCIDIIITRSVKQASSISAVPPGEVEKYLDGEDGHLWIMDNVLMYGDPKPLSFYGLETAPQSWCYVK
jgi:predicted transcriptional regulator